MKITLKDGSVKEYDSAKSVYEIAADLSEGLARAACAGELDGEVVDLRTVVDKDCSLNILTASDPEGLRVIRHTCSHVMAEAVKHLYPDAKLTIGPAIDNGFYYDFDLPRSLNAQDLEKIECEMKKIIKEANNAGVPCSVCGEMASSPLDAMALIGLGFRNLSVSSASYGKVKAMIRSLSARGVEDYLNNILSSSRRTLRPQLKSYAADHAIEIY